MNKITIPSTKSPYKVYLEKDSYGAILEVKRSGKYFIYEIKDNGLSSLIVSSEVPYTPEPNQKDEIYYLDYLSASALSKINTLTENYNYQVIIDEFLKIKNTIASGSYQFEDFSMDHANLFEDYKEVLNQLHEFTSEVEYLNQLKDVTNFFDTFFYNRNSPLSLNEREEIVNQLSKDIRYLEQLLSN